MRQFNIHNFPEYLRHSDKDFIFVVYGEERYFCDQMVHMIEKRFLDASSDRNLNYQQFYATETTLSEILTACLAFPMFADHKLVVVKDFDKLKIEDKDSLLKYIEKPQEKTILVLSADKWENTKLYSQILNSAVSVRCKNLTSGELYEWVEHRFHVANVDADKKSVTFLIENIGANVLRLNLEIEKIINFLGPGKKLNEEILSQLTGFTREVNIFNFQCSLGLRNLKTSLKIGIRLLEQGEHLAGIIPMLFIFFRRIWVVKHLRAQNYSQSQILEKLSGSRYVFKDVFENANKFSHDHLLQIFEKLQQADIELKSSQKSPGSILTMLCYFICRD